jgi:outer membrane PBP1 activator LpoA protein
MHRSEINQAESLLQQGKNKEAAAIYIDLATLNTNQRSQFQLLAADALIGSGNIKQGKKYIDAINTSLLTPKQFNHLKLLQAQVLLSTGDAKKASLLFQSMQVISLDNRSKSAYYDALALAYALLDQPIKSVQALIALEPFIISNDKRLQHYNRILETLITSPANALKNQKSSKLRTFDGWVALAKLFRSNQIDLTSSLAKWRKLYSNHPVTSNLLLEYEKKYQQRFSPPATIAVFLPRSGAYAEAAYIIKRGFMAAYDLAAQQNPNQAEVIFYDTESANIVDLYQQAINEGAQLVIGPLNKKYLSSLINSIDLNIPVLALNHVEGLNHPRLYQFGLSPIDDAEQIAYKAYQDGYKNALLLIPQSRRGERIGHYFTRHWQHLGANIANIQNYDAAAENFDSLIDDIASKALNSGGVDIIFMNAYTKSAAILNPLLRYKQETANLPIYATSHVYLGSENKLRDENLNGVTFCDIPWVFDDVYTGNLSKTALYTLWAELSSAYLRLLPLGIDAYNLIAHLDKLNKEPYSGAMGKLTLGSDNRINRELYCAQFVNGKPHLLGFATEKTQSTTPVVESVPENTTVISE